jgi:predicted RNA methylase
VNAQVERGPIDGNVVIDRALGSRALSVGRKEQAPDQILPLEEDVHALGSRLGLGRTVALGMAKAAKSAGRSTT